MITDPTDTLAYHQSRPLTTQRPMGSTHCSNVANAISLFMDKDTDKDRVPEKDALWFYGMNHGMALIRSRREMLEPLHPEELEFVRAYHATIGPMAVRAWYYMLLICTRESRHVKNYEAIAPQIKQKFGLAPLVFLKSILGTGSDQAYHGFLNNPPKGELGRYCKMLAWVFRNGKFGGSFGGIPWAQVAECLAHFVVGDYSAEVMMDTVWTLCHNNGPIFNKGMMYGMYSMSVLRRILDVQRSGQIPEMILTDHDLAGSSFVEEGLRPRMKWLTQWFPGEIGDYVDWYAVEALGSKSKYPSEKQAQLDKHGPSEKASMAEKKAAEAAKMVEVAKQMSLAAKKKMMLEIMPNVWVNKIDRKAA